MTKLPQAAMACALIGAIASGAQAFSDLAQSKKSLEATKTSWINFGSKGGRQIVMFDYFAMFKCDLKAVKYSLDSRAVDKTFAMPACDPANPFKVDKAEQLALPISGNVKTVSVQLVYADGATSPIRTYASCSLDDNSNCAHLIREGS
jgi:hypothetical protein